MGKFKPVLARFELYRDNVDRIITNVFPFEDVKGAFELAAERLPETGKIIIRFD